MPAKKKSAKRAKKLSKSKKIEPTKPLVSLNYSKIDWKY